MLMTVRGLLTGNRKLFISLPSFVKFSQKVDSDKWITNSHTVLETIPESERSDSVKSLDLERLPVERALGVHFDTLSFEISIRERPPTRRGILSVISSLYDPLGFASPYTLQGRSLLQDLCRKGLAWDDVISQEDLQTWQSWLEDLPKLESLEFDRCFKPKDYTPFPMHRLWDTVQWNCKQQRSLSIINKGRVFEYIFVVKNSI